MKHIFSLFFSIFLLISILICTGCFKSKEDTIQLDNSQPLALAPDVSWAVVSNPYAAYRKELGWDSESSGHCRKGEVLQILGRSLDVDNNSWYRFKDGWLPGESILIYDNRYKAQKKSEELTGK